jgi:hypothetical protein
MSLLKNFAILAVVNMLLTIGCIVAIYFLGNSDRNFKLPDSIRWPFHSFSNRSVIYNF